MRCITLSNPDFHDMIICSKLKQTLINGHREGRDVESTKGLRIFLTRNYLAIWRTFVVARVHFPVGNHVQLPCQILGCRWLK